MDWNDYWDLYLMDLTVWLIVTLVITIPFLVIVAYKDIKESFEHKRKLKRLFKDLDDKTD